MGRVEESWLYILYHPIFCLLWHPSVERSKSHHIIVEDCSWQLLSSSNSFTYKAVCGCFCSIVLGSCVEKRSRAQRVRLSTLSHPRSHRKAQHEAGSGRSLKSNFMRRSERVITMVGHSMKRSISLTSSPWSRLGCTSTA